MNLSTVFSGNIISQMRGKRRMRPEAKSGSSLSYGKENHTCRQVNGSSEDHRHELGLACGFRRDYLDVR